MYRAVEGATPKPAARRRPPPRIEAMAAVFMRWGKRARKTLNLIKARKFSLCVVIFFPDFFSASFFARSFKLFHYPRTKTQSVSRFAPSFSSFSLRHFRFSAMHSVNMRMTRTVRASATVSDALFYERRPFL